MDVVSLIQWTSGLRASALHLAEAVDAWRIAPRSFVMFYLYELNVMTTWFMGLADPTAAQAAFVTATWGCLIGVLGLYFQSGRVWSTQR